MAGDVQRHAASGWASAKVAVRLPEAASNAQPAVIITILNRRWRIKRPNRLPAGEYGYCESPNIPEKSIGVLASLRGERELETFLHEMLHAADWHKDEEWIERVAADIARALTRLGYRREE